MELRKISRSKKGAIELSIGTVVIIVIAMSMLILGLVLVRNIFTSATDSVSILDENVRNELSKLFAEEQSDILVNLGSDRTAKVRPDSETFIVSFGARSPDGQEVNRQTLSYELSLDTGGAQNCVQEIGVERTSRIFITPLDVPQSFDETGGAIAFSDIELSVPEGTGQCTQKVFIDVTDTTTGNTYAGSFFRIEILKEGFF